MSTYNRVHVYSVGPISLSACAPKDMALEEVTAAVNTAHPTGVSPWAWAEGENFSGGQTNPCDCELGTGKLHYLFHC